MDRTSFSDICSDALIACSSINAAAPSADPFAWSPKRRTSVPASTPSAAARWAIYLSDESLTVSNDCKRSGVIRD